MIENNVKENSDNEVPLTKVKGQKNTKVIEEPINEPNKSENLENITVPKPPKRKEAKK